MAKNDLTKAVEAVGKSYEKRQAGKVPGGPSRNGAFRTQVGEIAGKSPSNWWQIVDRAKGS